MASEQSNEASIFNAARKIESVDERNAFLVNACGDDAGLRERVNILLAAFLEESQFLEQPAPGLEQHSSSPLRGEKLDPTIAPDLTGKNFTASLDVGLTAAFGEDSAVVIGNTNHSVLKSISASLNEVPRVSLREPKEAGDEPIQRPSSPEVPNQESDSRYQLHGEIARGGMGAVLRGRDTDLGRDLAVKVLLDAHKDKPEVVQRFIEEAQIGGQLQHPGIAPVYELGQFADQRPFFSMKLVKGDTLSKLLSDREDPTADRSKLIGIFEQVCQTMAYAHSRGVIHRDLKPANIMVGAFGEVQVMDWGLAKVLSAGGIADEKVARRKQSGETIIQTMRSVGSDAPGSIGSAGTDTQMGSVMGTPAYMPPEQALGEIDMLDQRADVFGLGAILAEILTGKPPYVADDGTQIYRMASRGKLGDCFTRLDDCGADAELITLAKQCLEVEPTDRPKDATALAEQVTGYLESVETKLRTAEVQRARFRVTLGLGAATLAILIAGIAATAWQAREANKQTLVAQAASEKANEERDKARNAELEAVKARDKARDAELKADKLRAAEEKLKQQQFVIAKQRRRELYAANMQLADQLYNGQNGEQKRIEKLLASWIPIDDQEDLREFSWRYQWNRLHKSADVTVPKCKGVAITPTGKMVVTDSSGLHEVDENGMKNELISWTLKVNWSYFSPDGRWVAINVDSGIELYHIKSRRKVLSVPQTRCSFSSNGEYLAAFKSGAKVDSLAEDEPAIPVWKLEQDGSAASIAPLVIGDIKQLPKDGSNLNMGIDGKSFLLRDSPGLLEVYETVAFLNGHPEPFKLKQGGSTLKCAWSPDGKIIAAGGDIGLIDLRLTSDLNRKLTISTHGKEISSVRFSLDGNRLAAGGEDGTIDVWDVSELTSFAKRQTETPQQEKTSQREDASSIQAAMPRLIRTIKAHFSSISSIDAALNFSADGKLLASRDSIGNVKLWSLTGDRNVFDVEHVAEDRYIGKIPLQPFKDIHAVRIDRVLPRDIVKGSVETGEKIVAVFESATGEWRDLSELESWDDIESLLRGSPDTNIRLQLENSQGEQHEVELLLKRLVSISSFSVAIAPDGKNAAVASYSIGGTRLNLLSGEAKRDAHFGQSVAYSPDGRLLASGGYTTISILDCETEKELYRLDALVDEEFMATNRAWGNLAFSPDGKFLAYVSGFRYGTGRSDLTVWRTSDFKKIGGGPLHKEDFTMQSVVFSPDSSQLLTGDALGQIQIWDTSDWKLLDRIQTPQAQVNALAISPDGKRLYAGSATAGTGRVTVWDMLTRQQIDRFNSQRVGYLALSPDGRTLAVGSIDNNVVLWDALTGNRLQTIKEHDDAVFGVAFSKDGKRLATVSRDNFLRIWDAETKTAISEDSTTRWALLRLGNWRLEQERYSEAEALFSKVIKLSQKTTHHDEHEPAEVRSDVKKALDNLARLQERHGRWDEALESRKELVRLEPENHFRQYRVASAHLFLEDEESFWKVWQEMFDRWGDTESPRIGERIARLRLFRRCTRPRASDGIQVCGLSVFEKRKGALASFDVLLKGMAEYRRGNFVEALKHLEDAKIGFEGNSIQIGNGSMCQYFASMAHHQLGDYAEAKAAFLDARDRQHAWESDLRKAIGGSWHDWQQTDVVRREAAALLGIDESQVDPPDSDTSK